MTRAVTLSVVLPTFNERDNIVPMIERLAAGLRDVPYEILVMDDRSPDGTAAIARRLGLPEVVVVERQPPAGLTRSIADGVERARGEFVAWMDCDLSHPPEMIRELLAPLLAGAADISVASRYAEGGADVRDAFTRAYSMVINRLAQWAIAPAPRDYTTGYVVGARDVILAIGLRGEYGEYCIDLLGEAVLRGYRVVEMPYRMKLREAGESKTVANPLRFIRLGLRYLAVVARLALRRVTGAARRQHRGS